MRTALLLLSLFVLVGCWFSESDQDNMPQATEAVADVSQQAATPQATEAVADISNQAATPQMTEAVADVSNQAATPQTTEAVADVSQQADSAQGIEADVGDLECVAPWPAAAPVRKPNLLSPTIEERVAGRVSVVRVRLESLSHDLPSRARNNRIDLGRVSLEFNVLEQLKQGYHMPATIWATMEVGYVCEYIENDDRDGEALAELHADLEEFFGDKDLIMFLQDFSSNLHMTRARVEFRDKSIPPPPPFYGVDPLIQKYRFSSWNDGSQWLLQAEGTGSDQDPRFVDPLDAVPTADVPESIIALSEIRERVNAVVAEEEERGVECVGAHYRYQWYARSNEESWYRGRVASDGTPIECIEI